MIEEKAASKKMKIAVSGKSGCGNTTISRMVSEKLELSFINFTFRSLAAEKGLTLTEVLARAAEDEWWDREVDRRQVAMAQKAPGCVLGSRLAIWMLKEADLKVYLKASIETRTERIIRREGVVFEEVAAYTRERDRQDTGRYLRTYRIDNDDYMFADLIIDTENMGTEEIAGVIVDAANRM
jgi:cytidylate kinase